jgi:uncharacterized DUF497 family protein
VGVFEKAFSGRRLQNEHDFEWDEAKAVANRTKHRVRFEVVTLLLNSRRFLELDATRPGDREERRKAVGYIGSYLYAVIFTRREGRIRLISARRANAKEMKLYGNRQIPL